LSESELKGTFLWFHFWVNVWMMMKIFSTFFLLGIAWLEWVDRKVSKFQFWIGVLRMFLLE
jgi:hypothetical protein